MGGNPWISALLMWALAGVPADTPSVSEGKQQVREGDFEGALLTLDQAARTLSQDPGRRAELTEAYLYLGVAYAGLRQEGLAKAKFGQALALDPAVRLDPESFSARAIRAFEDARREREAVAALQKDTSKKPGKGSVALLAVGGLAAAAGAVGITAVVSRPEASNAAPTVSLTASPEVGLPSVTRFTFTASGVDPDGDALSYAWSLGDGSSATGTSVTHLFGTVGSFRVVVTAQDARLATATAEATVRTDNLDGYWDIGPGLEVPLYTTWLLFSGGRYVTSDHPDAFLSPTLIPPRSIELDWNWTSSACYRVRFSGTLDPQFRRMSGTVTGSGGRCGGGVTSSMELIRR